MNIPLFLDMLKQAGKQHLAWSDLEPWVADNVSHLEPLIRQDVFNKAKIAHAEGLWSAQQTASDDDDDDSNVECTYTIEEGGRVIESNTTRGDVLLL